jgi:phage tail sheath protein FI
MDCFPAYVKGDYAHKVFFKTMIAGQDAYTLQESEAAECPELDIAFESVTAGTDVFTVKEFAGKDLTTLGSNLSATVDRASIDFAGKLNYTPNWTEFGTAAQDLVGYYFPFQMKAENGAKFIMENTSVGQKTLVFGETGDGDGTINMVMAVNPDAPVMNAKLQSADESKTVEYSLDFSACQF